MGLCALAFVSCQKEELTGNDVEGAYVYNPIVELTTDDVWDM